MEEHSLIGEGNEEEWICLDDGTCRNVYFVDKKSSKVKKKMELKW